MQPFMSAFPAAEEETPAWRSGGVEFRAVVMERGLQLLHAAFRLHLVAALSHTPSICRGPPDAPFQPSRAVRGADSSEYSRFVHSSSQIY